jgi:hypothetical protein
LFEDGEDAAVVVKDFIGLRAAATFCAEAHVGGVDAAKFFKGAHFQFATEQLSVG